ERAYCEEAGLEAAPRYEVLGLPAQAFERVACRLPPRAGLAGAERFSCETPAGATATPHARSLLDICQQGVLPDRYALAPGSQMIQFVTEDVTEKLKFYARNRAGPHVLLPAYDAGGEWDPLEARSSAEGLENDGRVKLTTLEELFEHVAKLLEAGEWV